MYQLGARAIIVDGRVRDLEELGKRDDLMVFSKGVSTVGAGAEARAVAVDDVITVQGVDVASVCPLHRPSPEIFIDFLLCSCRVTSSSPTVRTG